MNDTNHANDTNHFEKIDIDDLCKKMAIYTQPKAYIGYWREHVYDVWNKYPFPIPTITKKNHYDIDKTIQILRTFGIQQSYFGYSPCRLCIYTNGVNTRKVHVQNGCSEYWIRISPISFHLVIFIM